MTTATRTASRCACGKRKSKYSNQCTSCCEERRARVLAENRAIVATGVCPQCGGKLKHMSAIKGWISCEQRGAEGFRKDASEPSCDFQTFTE